MTARCASISRPATATRSAALRFNFPNKFLVYQHDTPDKNLFARTYALTAMAACACENPVKYAEVLLSITQPKENYSQDRIRSMYGPGEHNINFPRRCRCTSPTRPRSSTSDGQLADPR